MAFFEIQSDIEEIAENALLYEAESFDMRVEAIDFIEFHIISQIESLLKNAARTSQLFKLKNRAEKVKSELEAIDAMLFQKVREDIFAGRYKGTAFKNLVKEYVAFNLNDNKYMEEPGYNNLDMFINGLLSFQSIPEPVKDLEPEMVFYQKTPSRMVFELAEKVPFGENDVFFDLGSGLGQVAILVNFLTGITAIGIEFEPAFCNYARDSATALNLSNVTFMNADARDVDYSEGTVFFMYTPFKGEILQEVLAILQKEAMARKIKMITYAGCMQRFRQTIIFISLLFLQA
jgi:predicted RNA methylase